MSAPTADRRIGRTDLVAAMELAGKLLAELQRAESVEAGHCAPFKPSEMLESIRCARINAKLAFEFLEDVR